MDFLEDLLFDDLFDNNGAGILRIAGVLCMGLIKILAENERKNSYVQRHDYSVRRVQGIAKDVSTTVNRVQSNVNREQARLNNERAVISHISNAPSLYDIISGRG
jgi:hypothetical protein